jgi:putative phage-type endonuclease
MEKDDGSVSEFTDRHTYLGGSDVAAALGLSPWKTPLAVYCEKRQEEYRAPTKNTAILDDPMFWGSHLEDAIADSAYKLGLKLRRVNTELIHPEHSFIRAHLDRKVVGRPEMVEIKNIGYRTAADWGTPETDEIPLYYMTQAFHYLGLTNYEMCHFLVLVGGQSLRHYVLQRDQEAINSLYAKEVEFWANVQAGTPPAPQSTQDLNALYPKSVSEMMYATPGMIGSLRMLAKATTEMKEKEEVVEAYKKVLKYEMKTADTLIIDDTVAATWKSQTRKGFDLQAFKEKYPEIYQEYQTTTSHRVFRPKKLT